MDAAPLDYARPRRRISRRWVLTALAAVVALSAYRYGETAWRRVSLAYHVREARAAFAACQQFSLPDGVVLYADRGATPRLRPGDVMQFGTGGWRPPAPDVPPHVAKPPSVW